MADGPAAGLSVVDGLRDVAALRGYQLLPDLRGDLLAKLGRTEEARAEFERAAGLTSNEAGRAHLLPGAPPASRSRPWTLITVLAGPGALDHETSRPAPDPPAGPPGGRSPGPGR
ncbi:MAG TPA: hypothetical protein VFU98_03665, partial [Microlunatus sp.]|nr:hypothetical protein [Microlunatus sp.]